MFLVFMTVYLFITLPVIMLIWAALVAAKWEDHESGYDLLEDLYFIF